MSKQAMTFEQIEDCYPDGASVNEFGEIIVSAQWLHDFARKIEEAIKQHDAEPVAYGYVWFDKNMEHRFTRNKPHDQQLVMNLQPVYLSAPSIPEGMMLANIAAVEEIIDAYVPSSVEQAYREALSASPQPTKGAG